MSGIIWDELQRLKLAHARWSEEVRASGPPDYVEQAFQAVSDAIAEHWPPAKPTPAKTSVMSDEEAAEIASLIGRHVAAMQAQQRPGIPPDPAALKVGDFVKWVNVESGNLRRVREGQISGILRSENSGDRVAAVSLGPESVIQFVPLRALTQFVPLRAPTIAPEA